MMNTQLLKVLPPDPTEEKPSKDFSWLIIACMCDGNITVLDASQGYHDCDFLGASDIKSFNDTFFPDTEGEDQNCVLKVEAHISESRDWETGIVDDVDVEIGKTIEVLWQKEN